MTAATGLPPRPPLLTALAWIWTALGALFTLISLLVAAAVLLVPGPFAPRIPQGFGKGSMPGKAVIDWLFAHFELMAVLQLLVAVAILLGGIFLLKQRAWARTLLEVIAWAGIAYSLLFAGWFAFHWLATTASVTADGAADPSLPFFRLFGVAAALMSALFYAAPLSVLLWMLRHRTVRAALVRGGRPPVDEAARPRLPGDGSPS